MEEQYGTCHVCAAWLPQGQMFRPLIGIDTLSRDRMYKTKLRAWGIHRYNLEQATATLAQTIETEKKAMESLQSLQTREPSPSKPKLIFI
jgi:hypothetical protein